MLTWELTNPSDRYTLQAEDFKVAVIVAWVLGEGKYGLQPIGYNPHELPLMLFGGSEEWCKETFEMTVEELMESINRMALAECLDTVTCGNRGDFDQAIEFVPAELRKDFKDKWQERNRSSMNNIGAKAYAIADSIRIGIQTAAEVEQC